MYSLIIRYAKQKKNKKEKKRKENTKIQDTVTVFAMIEQL